MKGITFLVMLAGLSLVATKAYAIKGETPANDGHLRQSGERPAIHETTLFDRLNRDGLPDAQELEQLLAREAAQDPEDLYRLGLAYENPGLWTPDYAKAFSYFQRSEALGYPWAKAQLAYYYEMGLAGDKNFEKAVKLYQQGADFGDVWSGLRLGYMYLDGLGVRQHDGQAFFWIQWASRGGSMQATASLGHLYETGTGTGVNLAEAARLYQEAGANGFPGGWVNLGLMHEFGTLGQRDLKRAAELYQIAADAGDPRGQHHLGTMYYWGLGVEEDRKRGAQLFRNAIELGYHYAHLSLGIAYEQGGGVEQSHEQAANQYLKAVEAKRFPRALAYLGTLHVLGLGVQQDLEKARALFEEAAASGDEYALTELGIALVEGGLLNDLDVDRGRRLLMQAADKRHTPAILALADMYERGLGVAIDPEEALKWYRVAEELGSSEAFLALGDFSENGTVVDQDFNKALEYYEKALERGDERALLELGVLYTNEDWPERDIEQGMSYFEKAEEAGIDGASVILGLAYFNGEWVEGDLELARAHFAQAAAEENVLASAYLGYMEEEGLGGLKELFEAIRHYENAAEGGNLYAAQRLVELYTESVSITQNKRKALKWRIRAGELGDAEAAYQAAETLYKEPRDQDLSKASELYRIAADDGNLDAAVKWARMQILDEVDGADFTSGLAELQLISREQPLSAMSALSQLVKEDGSISGRFKPERVNDLFWGLAYGFGVLAQQDLEKAEEYLRKSVEADGKPFPAAQYALSYFLFNAYRDDPDRYEDILHLLGLAADRGNANAQFSLAQVYGTGLIQGPKLVEHDNARSLMWLKLAARQRTNARFLLAVATADGWDKEVPKKDRLVLLEDLAETGHAEAAYKLGYFLSSREAGDVYDPDIALTWFEKSARFGNVDALNAIGLLHQSRMVENASQEIAYRYLLKAAEAGHAAAAGSLGWHLKNGVGTAKDLESAEHWYTVSTEGGDPWGKLGLAMLTIEEPANFSEGQKSEAVSVLLDFSRRDSVHAWMTLGRAYVDGIGVEKAPEKGLRYYQKSLQQKPAAANTALGNFYFLGLGGDVNYELAFEHYSTAAELGSSVSQNNLGWMYENGLYVEQDYTKAAVLYQQATDKGDPYAVTALGILYREGKGVPQDFDKANRLFQQAMRRGLPSGKANVGWMMLHGLGVPVNEREGFELLEEAAALNDQDGTYYLAVLLEKGGVVEANLQKAVELYENSANQGSFLAQAALRRLLQ